MLPVEVGCLSIMFNFLNLRKMKKIFLIFLCTILSNSIFSQGLTQSADGKSTIPIRGAAIGLDLNKTELSLGFNTLNKIVQSKE
jgi:hypothetical protein